MDLYVDSKTKQIYAEPGPNRVLMGSFEKVSTEPIATKAEVTAIREELDLKNNEIKALSDIIVTSSNAEKIISQLPENQEIIFAPDQHLGRYIAKKTGRDLILWQGSCMVHEQFSERELIKLTKISLLFI